MRVFLAKTSSFSFSNTGILLFAALLIAAVYGQCLTFDFVSYDDDFMVYNNLSVRQLTPSSVLEILKGKTRVVGDHAAQAYSNRIYIPFTLFSFQIQHALTGLNPFWFHAINLVHFTLLVFCVYRLFFVWLNHRGIAFICAILFILHPLNSEPVAWISARKDLLCGLFFILGILRYHKHALQPGLKNLAYTYLYALLATLSKPSGGVFLVVLLAYDFIYRRGAVSLRRILTEKAFFILLILTPVLYSASHYALDNNPFVSIKRLIFCIGVPLFELGHAVLPLSLSAFYPFPAPLLWDWGQVSLMLIGALGLILVLYHAKNEPQHSLFAVSFLFITLLPFVLRAAFFPDGGFTSDRYMLLPLVGLLLLVGLNIKELLVHQVHWQFYQRTALVFLGIGFMVFLALTAYQRAKIWKNSETLALDIVKKYPHAANAQEELGRIYQRRGLNTKAASHFKAAYFADSRTKRLIQLYEHYGLASSLIPLYQKALRENPRDNHLHAGLGMVYFRLRQFALAETYLSTALKKDTENDILYNALAGSLYYQNKTSQAIELWNQALWVNPNNHDAANNLGAAYMALGRRNEARQLFEQVLALNPKHPSALSNLEKIKSSKVSL